MEITFSTRITVGNDMSNYDIKCFSIDYDITKEDFEDFAKWATFDDSEAYFRFYLKDEEEALQEVLEILKDENRYWELKLYFSRYQLKTFKEFIVNKYQKNFEEWIVNVLTSNSSKTLNDLIDYNF